MNKLTFLHRDSIPWGLFAVAYRDRKRAARDHFALREFGVPGRAYSLPLRSAEIARARLDRIIRWDRFDCPAWRWRWKAGRPAGLMPRVKTDGKVFWRYVGYKLRMRWERRA